MEFENFYTNLFGSKGSRISADEEVLAAGPKLSLEDQNMLVSPVTHKEFKEALLYIGDDKALGPDGFSSAFFKKNWAIVGEDVLAVVMEFFNRGQLLWELNHTIITLIPKKSHELMVTNYWPIACTNVIYKTITKILSNRISPLLKNIINLAQVAFIKGQNLTDNFLLAQELIRYYKRKRMSPRCMIKIDLQKAYDSISWTCYMRSYVGWTSTLALFIEWWLV